MSEQDLVAKITEKNGAHVAAQQAATAPVPALKTRKPTGLPSWPVLLVAGAEKSGKSWACAEASASTKIGRTLWLSIGETDPDAYGAIPGADFEIIEHDGSYGSILNALRAVAALPAEEKPTLLVVDSMTRLWDLLTESAQVKAQQRAERSGRAGKEVSVSMDIWNTTKSHWQRLVKAILDHRGPVLLTARLEAVTVLDVNGKPTPLKADKIKTEKSLPYDVDGVIEMPERGKVFVSGVRSTVLQLAERREFPGFTVDGFWDQLGLGRVAERVVSHPVAGDIE